MGLECACVRWPLTNKDVVRHLASYRNTWEHIWEICKRVDRPNFGLCLDTFHICGTPAISAWTFIITYNTPEQHLNTPPGPHPHAYSPTPPKHSKTHLPSSRLPSRPPRSSTFKSPTARSTSAPPRFLSNIPKRRASIPYSYGRTSGGRCRSWMISSGRSRRRRA